MNPTRRWIFGGLVAILASLVFALIVSSRSEAVEPSRSEPGDPAARTPAPTSAEGRPTPDRNPLTAPPAHARRAERGPVVLTGRVVDDVGRSVEGAQITVQPLPPSAPPEQIPLEQLQQWYQRLRDETKLSVRELEDGRFEVRGWTQAERVRLSVRSRTTYLDRDCAVGTRGLELEIPRLGSVAGVLWHDRGISGASFELCLIGSGEAPPIALDRERYRLPDRRTFSADRIPVGSYALEVRLHKSPAPLLRVDGIQVRADEPCADERLQRIDTRGLCRRIVVRLMRPDGQALPLPACLSAEVKALDPNGEPLPLQPDIRRSRVELITRYPYVDLRINVPRYQGLHLPLLDADCEVRLEPVE